MGYYSKETFEQDKQAVEAAQHELNRLACGEGTRECQRYWDVYERIADYFTQRNAAGKLTSLTTQGTILRMFKRICTQTKVDGTYIPSYAAKLEEIRKKIKSMQSFRVRPKIKCFQPRNHRQPCFCARLEAVHATVAIANSPAENGTKELLTARVQGAMTLEAQFRREEA
jgi:hypothetical protein